MERVSAKECLAIDRGTAEVFGRVASELDARGRPSAHRVQDLWIGSLALQHGHKVLTRNPRHFEDIPGLTVLSI
jgi:predicted nucleic acid-binding protein